MVTVELPALQCLVVPVNDLAAGYDYPVAVRFEITEQDLPSYLRAADLDRVVTIRGTGVPFAASNCNEPLRSP